MLTVLLAVSIIAIPPRDSGYISTPDGARLFYETIGTGGPVVLVPGRLFLERDFARLAHGRTLVLYDMRDRGRSSAIRDSASIGIMQDVADLELVRQHIGADHVTLIGWSYLGYMVMLYAIAHPEHVDRVVQLGPVPWRFDATYPDSLTAAAHPAHPSAKDVVRLRIWKQQGYKTSRPRDFCLVEWAVDRVGLVGDSANVHKLGPGWCDMPNEWPVHFDRHLAVFFATVERVTTTADQVRGIQVPVLTIHGTWDRNAPYGSGREWAATLPHAQLVTVPGAGHFSWIDAPDVVFPAIDQFLR